MKKLLFPSLIAVLISSASCSGDNSQTPEPPAVVNPDPKPVPGEKIEIRISPTFASRATDFGFEMNDCIGLYVVNYDGITPGMLKDTGNHVDNMRFKYSGSWTPDTPIYWKDEDTHADFYLFYPYKTVGSVSAMPFDVMADQSGETAYKASDMLWGKATDATPTATAIGIPASHVMSRIEVKVEAGNGFTRESLAASNVSVRVNALQCKSTVNIATGTVTPTGDRVNVTPMSKDGAYVAIVVPQTVPEGNLITVTVDGQEFNLRKGFTFQGGKNHQFNVIVSKTTNGINVSISPWEQDGIDNGGTAE
ncbi:MAG: fimbrillin family protein [Duncaniella sp.]|nr:fimbrillin family protein [Duncaniella sp.]